MIGTQGLYKGHYQRADTAQSAPQVGSTPLTIIVPKGIRFVYFFGSADLSVEVGYGSDLIETPALNSMVMKASGDMLMIDEELNCTINVNGRTGASTVFWVFIK